MINIVVYGKPRAFESHEYGFDVDNSTSVDNSFPEPILKPKKYQEMVLHYFSREDGCSGIEYYNRAKGYESERDGIVFGIALKTDHDFDITKVVDNILEQYWSDFASVLLNDEDRFSYSSILEILNGTKWSQEDISLIQGSVKRGSPSSPNKDICLLYAPDYDQIQNVESKLKEYADVYISYNLDIFKDPINSVVLNLTGGKIHTIKDGAIVELQEGNTSSTPSTRKRPIKWGVRNKEGKKNNIGSDKNNLKEINDDSNGNGEKNKRILIATITGIVAAVIAIVVMVFLHSGPQDDPKGGTGGNVGSPGSGSVGGPSSPSENENITVEFSQYNNPINNSFDLSGFKLNKPESSSIVMDDITVDVDKKDIVEIKKENGKTKLVVIKHPDVETTVTVTASYNNTVVGTQTYKIAKKEIENQRNPQNKTVEYQDVRIKYNIGNQQSWFPKGTKIDVTAEDKNGAKVSGNWILPSNVKHEGNINGNSITIWSDNAGEYNIRFEYNNNGKKEAQSTQFKVTR